MCELYTLTPCPPLLLKDITECILSLLVEREWPIDAVPLDECVRECLAQFPDFSAAAVRHCVRSLSTVPPGSWEEWQQSLEKPQLVCSLPSSPPPVPHPAKWDWMAGP